jgi:hypothetical protein
MPTQKLETPKPINRPQAPSESESQTAEQPRLKALVAETDSPMRNRLVQLLSGDCQFYCRNSAEGPVAFLAMDNNGSHAQVLTRDGCLVRRRINHGTALPALTRLVSGEVGDFVKRFGDEQRRGLMQIARADDQVEHVTRVYRV